MCLRTRLTRVSNNEPSSGRVIFTPWTSYRLNSGIVMSATLILLCDGSSVKLEAESISAESRSERSCSPSSCFNPVDRHSRHHRDRVCCKADGSILPPLGIEYPCPAIRPYRRWAYKQAGGRSRFWCRFGPEVSEGIFILCCLVPCCPGYKYCPRTTVHDKLFIRQSVLRSLSRKLHRNVMIVHFIQIDCRANPRCPPMGRSLDSPSVIYRSSSLATRRLLPFPTPPALEQMPFSNPSPRGLETHYGN